MGLQPRHGLHHFGHVWRLQQHAVAALLDNLVEHGNQLRHRQVFTQVVAGAEYGRVQCRHDTLQRTAHQLREAVGRLHHHVEQKFAANQPHLALLPLQLLQCLFDPVHGVLAYTAALVQHPVYGGNAGASLRGNIF